MLEFDAYLMVDWSANSKPTMGKNSIWYCRAERVNGSLRLSGPENPETRNQAVTEIRNILVKNVERGVMTLVGFDFPYGYPKGFAAVLGLDDEGLSWRRIWNLLVERTTDNDRNVNNRFEVAAELNKQISGEAYPFWGCPKRFECRTLSRRKPHGRFKTELPVKRLTEARESKTQPVWKLAYKGSVGSQALVGIPHVARLRDQRSLSQHSRVWPFETGLKRLPTRGERSWSVLHAEIFPSIINVSLEKEEVRDAEQVRALAWHFAQQDEKGELSRLFVGPDDLSDADRQMVENEEGWILGL